MKTKKLKKDLELAKMQLQHYEKLFTENPHSFFHQVLVSNTKSMIAELEQALAEDLVSV